MNVSGILVVAASGRMADICHAVAGVEGVEVHYTDPPTGRIVATIEAESVGDEADRLRQIQTLPGVILAELVYHHFEDDPEIGDRPIG